MAEQQMQVVCPSGCTPGTPIQITTPAGAVMAVQVPHGVEPGAAFIVNVSTRNLRRSL